MTSVIFTVLLCVAVLSTALLTSWAFSFHESDAAGQGLAKAFTVFGDIALLIVLAALLVLCAVRGAFSSGGGLLGVLLYVAGAAAHFATLVVLTGLHKGDRFELALRLLFPLGPALLIVYAAVNYYASAPPARARLAVASALVLVALTSFIALGPAKASSAARNRALQQAFQEARDRDRALAAEVEALPAGTPLVDFLRYTDVPPDQDSDARRAAIKRMSRHADRQAQVESALDNLDTRIFAFLGDLDVTVTPRLCQAARKCSRKLIGQFRPTQAAPTFASVEMQLNVFTPNLRWLLENGCDCKEEIAGLEKNVRLYPDPYPKKFYLDHLLELQGKPRE